MNKKQLFTSLSDITTALQGECDRMRFSPAQLALKELVECLDVVIDHLLEDGVQDDAPLDGAPGQADPMRLYRFADAPAELRALSDAGGGEVLLAVVPVGWLDEAVLNGLPHVLWLLLDADTVQEWPQIERQWGAVQRVAGADGSAVVIVSRP